MGMAAPVDRLRPHARVWWIVLSVVWGLSAAYMATQLKRGWVPHDEGALAQSAERVLAGELPHRDFDEVYTGGLSYLHALAFRVLGTNLGSLRIVLFIWFLAWVPVVYYIATRFASPLPAGGVTLLAVAWSLPNYAAAVPSWYNLFFAVFGAAALLRHVESGSRLWMFLAGLCGGLSFLAKVSGLYYVAAVLLFLVFREQCLAHAEQGKGAKRGRVYPLFVAGALLLFVALLFTFVRSSSGSAPIIHFVLPGAVLAILLLWGELEAPPGTDRKRFGSLFWMLAPYGAGLAIPIVVFLIPYLLSGAPADFVRGVFVLPAKRLSFAAFSPPGLVIARPELPPYIATKATLALVAIAGMGMYLRGLVRWVFSVMAALGLGLVLLASAERPLFSWYERPLFYWYAWYSLPLLVPLAVLVGVVLLKVSKTGEGLPALRLQQLMLLLSITAMGSLVQHPFAAPIYFCYVAPLLALAVLALLSLLERPPRFLFGALVGFYLLFAVLRVTPSFIYAMGRFYSPDPQTKRLTLARAGGLRVDPAEAQEYEQLIALVQGHAAGGYMYAAPDCPEVYYLSGLRNPTRALFDFMDDAAGRAERTLSALEAHQVNVVAILNQPAFSAPLAPNLRTALTERFPHSTTVGRFHVRWRQ